MPAPISGESPTRPGRLSVSPPVDVAAAKFPKLADNQTVNNPVAIADGRFALALALGAFGAGVGLIDVAINIQAVTVEKAGGRSMMSGFHGFFSIGGIAGAGGVSALLWLGASPLAAALGVVALILATLAIWGRDLLPAGGAGSGPAFAWPRGVVAFVGALCFVCFLAEGAMLDWSAVFLSATKAMPAAIAGVGYASFSVAMTIGRLYGDAIVDRLGGGRVLAVGGSVAALGFAVSAVAPGWPASLIGFAMIGLGCSNIVPVLFTATGRQQAMPEGLAVAAVSTMGYSGILLGPAFIGFVSQAISLQTAWLAVGLGMLGVAVCAGFARNLGLVSPARP